ncbi:alpha/beta hydrolase [Brooklawnia cerclae]|uniref:Pimeloyl-ACP methyl ester carboxylesterase n=2 Tax=Brooklawnia cerclae TaxID=349934 RepID=A0ABX0SFE5_9ACTN|nr:pimeloyl-ACP methyl ester carboxylesterase [Brooklawnia cerclae]
MATIDAMHVVRRGTGTPLVLLHGFSLDHRALLPLDTVIDQAGDWERLYVDLPGHGRTPVGDVNSADDVAAAVEDEIRTRVGTRPFAVLGNSFGGMIARRVAHDLRDQALGLATLAGVFVADHDHRDVPDRTVLHEAPRVVESLGNAGEEYAELAVVQSADNAQAFLKWIQPGLEAADQEALARISERYDLAEEPETASLTPFTRPTLIVTGRQDQVVGYRDAWASVEHYPRATFAVLDTAGHNVHLDRASLVAALVTDWLERVSAEPRQ